MDALSIISDSNVRRHHYRGFHSRTSSKKSVETGSLKDVTMSSHRTASLTTLSSSSNNNYDTESLASTDSRSPVIRNVGRLETLEAKMATIESSLSRKRVVPDDMWQCLPKGAREVVREIEVLRRSLKEKDVLILRLRRNLAQLCGEPTDAGCELNIEDKRRLEDRLKTLRRDVDCRQIGLKKLRCLLERLKGSENIDVRIQRAELEYQLEKEELNILNVELEAKGIEKRLQDSSKAAAAVMNVGGTGTGTGTVVNNGGTKGVPASGAVDAARTFGNLFVSAQPEDETQHCLALLRVTVKHDPENPKFELTDAGDENDSTVVVERADSSTRLEKGDRILEINGRCVTEDCAEEIRADILSGLKPDDRVELVVSRELTTNHVFEAKRLREELSVVVDTLQGKLKENQDLSSIINKHQKEKEVLKTDSQRMAHRISYLEDQVSELERLVKQSKEGPGHQQPSSKTGSNNGSSAKLDQPPVQVYQRGPNVATVTVNSPSAAAAWETPVKAVSSSKSKSSSSSSKSGGNNKSGGGHHHQQQQNGVPPPVVKEKPMQLLQNAAKLDFFRSIGPKTGGFYVSSSSSTTGCSTAASEVSFSDSEHRTPHYQVKNKPAPPKKPDRLHLYRATSVQSVDAVIDAHNNNLRKRKHNRPSFPPEYHPHALSSAGSDVGAPTLTSTSSSASGTNKSSLMAQKWPSLQGFRLRQNAEMTAFSEATQKARVQWC